MKKLPIILTCALLVAQCSLNAASCSTDPVPAPRKNITTKDHNAAVTAIALTVCGHEIATGDSDGCIKIWQRKGDRLERVLAFHAHPEGVRSVAFFGGQKGSMMISGGNDKKMRTWSLSSIAAAGGRGVRSRALEEHFIGDSSDVGVSVEGGFVAGRREALVESLNNEIPRTMMEHLIGIRHARELNPDLAKPRVRFAVNSLCEHMVAFETVDGEVYVGPLGGQERQLKGFGTSRVTSMAFSPCGKLLVAALSDQIVYVWNVQVGTLVKRFLANKPVCSVSVFSGKSLCGNHACPPVASFVAIGLQDGTLGYFETGFVPDSK